MAYPLAMTGVSQVVFPRQANGSLVRKDGQVIGSALLGQALGRPEYFQPRSCAACAGGRPCHVTKPFGMNELLARLRTAVRRVIPPGVDPVVTTTEFTIDFAKKTATGRAGDAIRLTPNEWRVVEVLVRNEGRLVTKRELLREVWGPNHGDEADYLRSYLAAVRRKLEADPSRPRHFITEPGMGYRFES